LNASINLFTVTTLQRWAKLSRLTAQWLGCINSQQAMGSLIACLLAVSAITPLAYADITLDGSYGRAGALTPVATDYRIDAALGVQQGTQLFHSFATFNLAAGESATFTGEADITHIFSRVTGGSPSHLDGTLRSTMPVADLYFLNPAGVIFGENARLALSGSFYVSTADYLQFSDGTRWATTTPTQAVLTAAHPVAFGFLDTPPASITKHHSLLAVSAGETLALIGGDITLADTAVTLADGRVFSSFLAAPGGQLTLVSTAANTEIPHDAAELLGLTLPEGNTLSIRDANPSPARDIGNLHSSGAGGGQILIRAGALYLDNAYVFADSNGEQVGRGVNIQTADSMTLTNSARITAEALGTASAGDIQLTTKQLHLAEGSQIVTATRTQAAAGTIQLTAHEAVSMTGRQDLTIGDTTLPFSSGLFSNTFGTGGGGDIELTTPALTLSEGGEIRAATLGLGTAGTVDLDVASLHLASGAQINVSSGLTGLPDNATRQADAGELNIQASQAIELTGATTGLLSNSFTQGQGGRIHLITPQLRIHDQATIQAGSTDLGNAGNLIIQAEQIALQDSRMLTQALQSGGGDITLYAVKQIYLRDSRISAAARGASPADRGGNLHIEQPEFLILANSELLATAFVGNGGDITLVTDNFINSSHSRVDASSQLGIDGQILITAPDKQVDASLIALSGDFNDAARLIQERCNPWQKNASRFYLVAQTGLPASPTALLEHHLSPLAAIATSPVATAHTPSVPHAWLLAECQPSQRATS